MKIESQSITYVMEHEFSSEKTDTFNEALASLSSNEAVVQEQETSRHEQMIDWIKQVKCLLIQELLKFLSGTPKGASQNIQDIFQNNASYTNESSSQFQGLKFYEVNYESTYKEEESLSVQTQGCVKTTDGRSIQLNLEFNMQRSFYAKTRLTSTVVDPLVITMDGTVPELTDTTFSFDIDCDGTSDQISRLANNSGFLALDKNQNGKIDDGSELFGTQSGNGFKDLSQYDADNNHWIDENDAIYDGLRIWSNNKLIGLGELGIGAIYLGAQSSPFMFKNDANECLGILSQSGIFLFESGKAGVISQIDFAKQGVQEPFAEVLAQV